MKIKFEVETNSGKKLSLADLKKKAKDVVNVLKEDSNVQKAQEKVKGFVNTAADLADNAIEKVEDYIDQKLADEKNAGPDDITEDFFEADDDESDTGESGDEIVAEDIAEDEEDSEEPIAGCIIIIGPQLNEEPVKVSFEEFMDEIVNFEESDEKPDISVETESFLSEIEYFSSDVSKAAFKAVINLQKITYVSVINAIKEEFPEMSRNEIRELLKADFKNWVNVRQPELKEDCPNANCITLLKYWAKKFKEF